MIIGAEDIRFDVEGKHILQGINFFASEGEFVGLLGPNGAGKSTLLRTLAGLNTPTAGAVTIEGDALPALPAQEVARRVAYVPQDTNVTFDFSVWEIVLMGRHPHINRFAMEGERDHVIAARALEDVGASRLAERTITSLSGGERQMVFIAKALAQEPRVLLLDEPISALDIRHQLHVLDLVRSYTQTGATAIAVLHDLNLAARFCDRLYMVADGRVVSEGAPEVVYTEAAFAHSYRVTAAVRHDELVGRPTVTALTALDRGAAAGADRARVN